MKKYIFILVLSVILINGCIQEYETAGDKIAEECGAFSRAMCLDPYENQICPSGEVTGEISYECEKATDCILYKNKTTMVSVSKEDVCGKQYLKSIGFEKYTIIGTYPSPGCISGGCAIVGEHAIISGRKP